jgi:hypothetical protein
MKSTNDIVILDNNILDSFVNMSGYAMILSIIQYDNAAMPIACNVQIYV